jgi:glucokinase
MPDTSDQDGRIWVGFDLGGTKMLAVLYDDDFRPAGKKRRKTRGNEGADSGLDRIESTIEKACSEAGVSLDRIAGIGIGCPGPVDLDKGRILQAPNLGWDDVNVSERLAKRFSCPAYAINDVDAGVYGEYRFGAAVGSRCAVGVFPGTGIGGGCVYQGQILQGAGISCMEIGHTRISSSARTGGYSFPGTLEAEASRLTVAAEAIKAAYRGDAPYLMEHGGTDLKDIRSGTLAQAISAGDVIVHTLVEEAARTIGLAVVNIVHILAPDRIILGGGLVEAMEELFVGTVRKTARKYVMPPYRERFEVVPAKLGDDATVLGAAAWAKKLVLGDK